MAPNWPRYRSVIPVITIGGDVFRQVGLERQIVWARPSIAASQGHGKTFGGGASHPPQAGPLWHPRHHPQGLNLFVQLRKSPRLAHQERPPGAIPARDRPAFRRDQVAPAEMPAGPSITRQLHIAHEAQQLVGRIRNLMATAAGALFGAEAQKATVQEALRGQKDSCGY